MVLTNQVVLLDLDVDQAEAALTIRLRGVDVGVLYRAPGQPHHGLVELYVGDYRPEDLVLIGQTVQAVIVDWPGLSCSS